MQRLHLNTYFLNPYLIPILLFLSALVVRGLFAIFVLEYDRPLGGDEAGYHWRGELLSQGFFGDSAYRPPFTGLTLAPFYALFGAEFEVGRIVMVFVSACTAPIVFYLGQTITRSTTIGVLAAIYWVFYPPAIWYSVWIHTETWSAVLVSMMLFLYYRARRSTRYLPAIFLGIFWGFLALNRSVFLFLPLLFLISYGLCQLFKIQTTDIYWKQLFAALLSFVVVMSPWTIHNYEVHGSFIPHSTQGGFSLLATNRNLDHPHVQIGGYEKNKSILLSTELAGVTELGIDRIRRQLAIESLQGHLEERKLKLLKVITHRAGNFWSWRPDPFDKEWTRNDSIMLFVWLPILFFLILSPVFRSWRTHLPVLLTIFYCFVFVLPFWGTPRFRFPIDPAIVILGIWGIVNCYSQITNRIRTGRVYK